MHADIMLTPYNFHHPLERVTTKPVCISINTKQTLQNLLEKNDTILLAVANNTITKYITLGDGTKPGLWTMDWTIWTGLWTGLWSRFWTGQQTNHAFPGLNSRCPVLDCF